jgi:hypothetical protein
MAGILLKKKGYHCEHNIIVIPLRLRGFPLRKAGAL